MSLGAYLAGTAGLLVGGLALLFASIRVRAWLLPEWSGPPARLAEAIAWLGLVVWLSQLLGVFGLFEPLPLLLGAAASGIGLGYFADRRARDARRSPDGLPPAPAPDPLALLAAGVAAAIVVAAWAVPVAQSFSAGIDGADSTWYHLPHAARIAQTGTVGELHFTDPYFLNWFYPQNTELLHALGMTAFDADFLSPLVNLGFLALGLLAAWCIGRPWGLGPHTLIAASLVFGMEMTLDFQAGEARNDAAALAMFLASVALIVTARTARTWTTAAPGPSWSSGTGLRALGLAGVAAGLAAGTKLSLLAPVAALSVGIVLIAATGTRLRVAATWLAGLAAGGGFWFARNLIEAGNPLPWIESLGPISLPSPERALELRPEYSVAHYFGDFDVWENWLLPGLGGGLGPLWPALLTLVGMAAGLALLAAGGPLRRRKVVATRPFEGRAARAFGGRVPPRPTGTRPLLAMLAGVALVSIVAYAFTPLTASGEEGQPVGFVWNLRYLGPALALGLVLLPLVWPLRDPPWTWVTLSLLFSLLVVQVALLDVWSSSAHLGWAAAAGGAVIAALAFWGWVWREGSRAGAPARSALALAGAALATGLVAAGFALQRSYLENRYVDSFAFFDLDEAVAWANDVSDARIATAGRGGVFFQYSLYGEDLSNHVQWVGLSGPHGAWLPASDCAEWRRAVNQGEYDYVVTTFDGVNPVGDDTSVQREWIQDDPEAREVLAEGPVAVYELTGALDPGGCDGRGSEGG